MSRTASDPSNSDKDSTARDLAQRLLARELAAKAEVAEEATMPPALRVCEKLRHPLSAVVGTTGFRTLLARALALARAQAPSLGAVQVNADGSLHGLNGLTNNEAAEAGAVLVAQLLGLLSTFIGEEMMLRLVLDAWPMLSPEDLEFRKGRKA